MICHWALPSMKGLLILLPGVLVVKASMLIAQLCPTLCNPMGYSLPGSSVCGMCQAKILEWVAIPFSGDLPNPEIKHRSPALQVDSLLYEPPGKWTPTGGKKSLASLQRLSQLKRAISFRIMLFPGAPYTQTLIVSRQFQFKWTIWRTIVIP